MSFTNTDLTNLETAIRALSVGGAVSVRIGEKEYRKEDLKSLRETYTWMRGQINETADGGVLLPAFKGKLDL